MDFDECVSAPAQNCSYENLQFSYFCGSARLCQNGSSSEAVQRAKYNVEAYFSVVGLSHDLKRSFQLLEALLPRFFSGAPEVFRKAAHVRINANSYKPIANSTISYLMALPWIENEFDFFNFIQQHFELQYRSLIEKNNAQSDVYLEN